MIKYNSIMLVFKFTPLLIFMLGWWFLKDRRFLLRYPIMIFGGWGLFLAFSLVFWSYAIDNAPNQTIAMDLAERDGAPKTFALLFGWLYSLILLLVLDGGHTLIKVVRKKFNKIEPKK